MTFKHRNRSKGGQDACNEDGRNGLHEPSAWALPGYYAAVVKWLYHVNHFSAWKFVIYLP